MEGFVAALGWVDLLEGQVVGLVDLVVRFGGMGEGFGGIGGKVWWIWWVIR